MKKNAALLRFLAFLLLDHIFGVPRGEQPLGRASRAIGSSGHLFRFLFGCPKRKGYRKYAMILEGLPQGGNPDAAININFFQKPLDLKPMFNATLVAETNQVRDTCHG